MAKNKPAKPTPVESVKHTDTRKNIPTEELRDFISEEDRKPKHTLYPRDESLDPQLVWRGKDEQDSSDLSVLAAPIYIQEKIHPQALVENLRDTAKKGEPEPELSLFDDFNGITDFEQKIDFYNHEQHWANRMILGDSMLVMNSLAEKEGLKGKVQMIYIDPPYGIKFGSNWQVSTRKRDVKDSVADATRQPEQVKAFRDTWELGIHSYLAYLRDRLVIARELLTETGSIFVQIGDENVHLVRCLLDEVFGSENFVAEIVFQKTGSQASEYLPVINDYICCYAKQRESMKWRNLFAEREERDESQFSPDPLTSSGATEGSTFTLDFEGVAFHPGSTAHWKSNRIGMQRLIQADRIVPQKTMIRFKKYWQDFPVKPYSNLWTGVGGAGNIVYVVQTNVEITARCLLMTTDPGDLVLDPTCGSGTTAYVAEQWGRRWITIDTSRVALALARSRLMSARYPYYLLADSPEGVQKEAEITGKVPVGDRTGGDVKKGFVYKRVPHITLKSIANNEEIDGIYDKWQEKLEPVREQINKKLGKGWEEWEIPREADDEAALARDLIEQWWNLRRRRQKEIDDSIARRADVEMLYDQPYEDRQCVRVTGPFTVESLSPHRHISVQEKNRLKDEGIAGVSMKMMGAGQFALDIIENLKKAGVQNTIKNERLKFDTLETYPGEWLHAAGEYTETDSSTGETHVRRVAVCIGPEYGTVSADLIKEAAKEAVKGIGFDTLIVCGFAFDPNVNEDARLFGSLVVLTTTMNPDLMMGDELLKKTGAGNLFMVFGEPDIDISRNDEGKVVVKINGLDVYDPTTGVIRSNTTDDIACWFIDTDYDEESFFVRHAYFTGAGDPYAKLKSALKAEIDEAAWASLYSTESRPFDVPDKRKIAVKVINHYGDEVLKVYDIR